MINDNLYAEFRPQPVPLQSPADSAGQWVNLQNLANQGQLQQAQTTGVNLENQQRQIQMDNMRKLNDAYKGALNPDGTIDTGKLSSALAANGTGSQIPAVLKGVTEYQQSLANLGKSRLDVQNLQADALGSFGKTMQAADYDPQLFLTKAQMALSTPNALDPQQVPQLRQQIQQVQQSLLQDPTGAAARKIIQPFADNAVASSEKWATIQAQQDQAKARLLQAGNSKENADRQKETADTASAAKVLANSASDAEYQQKLAVLKEMSPNIAAKFPAQFDSQAVLRVGMTPDQIAADERNRTNQANEQAYREQMLGLERIRTNLEATRISGGGAQTPDNAANQNRASQADYEKAQTEEQRLNNLRSQLGVALTSGGKLYVSGDDKGNAKLLQVPTGGDKGWSADQIQEMQRGMLALYQQTGPAIKNATANKNAAFQRVNPGQQPKVSNDQANADYDAGDATLYKKLGVQPPAPPAAAPPAQQPGAAPGQQPQQRPGAPAPAGAVKTVRLPDGRYVTGTQAQLDAFMKEAGLKVAGQ
jgi:hypothetical protein